MLIESLKTINFRCFDESVFDFTSNTLLIVGKNGSGKTSLLEALYVACYGKSFRTHQINELVSLGKGHFFVSLAISDRDNQRHEVAMGVDSQSKVVRLDGKQIRSHRELLNYLRVVAVCEDDLALLQGAPEERRSFLNQSLFLLNPESTKAHTTLKRIITQRNALLAREDLLSSTLLSELRVWTIQLWELSRTLQNDRILFLVSLLEQVNKWGSEYCGFDEGAVSYTYLPKKELKEDFESFWAYYQNDLFFKERATQRTLFGAHLDDVLFSFKAKDARSFASRGQKKLLIFLLKLAQLSLTGNRGVLLLDDFLTDFDREKLAQAVALLKDAGHTLFISLPYYDETLMKTLGDYQIINFDK